jgi:hypothetical protein
MEPRNRGEARRKSTQPGFTSLAELLPQPTFSPAHGAARRRDQTEKLREHRNLIVAIGVERVARGP